MLTSIDMKLAESVVLEFSGAGQTTSRQKVIFQFPPRMVNDSRSGTWSDNGDLRGDEPTVQFKVSGARTMKLEWTYIVGEATSESRWSTLDVKKQVAGIRNYFSGIPHRGKAEDYNVNFKMWAIGGILSQFCARIISANISHGKAIIVPSGNYNDEPDVSRAFPLRTDISIDLRLWTAGGVSGGAQEGTEMKNVVVKCLTVPLDWV